jgi:chromosome segregation ATPase
MIKMNKNEEIENLKNENNLLKKELETQKSYYKQLSTDLGQSVFECEELDKKIRLLERENEELIKENEELKIFKEKIESTTSWKITSLFK